MRNLEVCDCDVIHDEVVKDTTNKMPKDSAINGSVEIFKALSTPTRVKILWALKINEMCVCDIAVLLDMTKSAISHQLKYLKEFNLIKSRKQGKQVYYSIVECHIKELLETVINHVLE